MYFCSIYLNANLDNHTHPVPGAPFQDPAIMSSVPYMPTPNNGGFHFSPAENSPSENVLSTQLLPNRPPGLSYQNSQHLGSQGTIPGQLGSSMMMGNGPVHSPMMQNQVHAQGPLGKSLVFNACSSFSTSHASAARRLLWS